MVYHLLAWGGVALVATVAYWIGHSFGRQAERAEMYDEIADIRDKACPHGWVDWDHCPVCCH